MAFQQHQEHPQIQIQFWFYLIFIKKMVELPMTSSLQFQTVSNQVSVPSTHPKFSRNTKAQHEMLWWFGRSDHDKQNKTNYLAS